MVPVMYPAPGDCLKRFVGDRVRFVLTDSGGQGVVKGWRARLRTNLGRAEVLRREIIQAHAKGLPLAGASWRDLPMNAQSDGWHLELPLTEVGFFKAKAYLVDSRGWQHWPLGDDVGISVHPDGYRTANAIYCAFTRMFGETKSALGADDPQREHLLRTLDKDAYTVIPPSGKLRDVIECLPHIIDSLGCRILHLLPVNPTPTTYARFGRFGSPYAALDLTAIDPALVAFDRRTTGIDQFCELTYATHLRGARVFLDIVINHTGWGSVLQENHPEWFLRQADGSFASPGAWGVTWEDLAELKHQNVALWDELAEVFLTWCRRGVDGFRCDAGYKVPVAAWQYIIARVRQEFPETLFLLEGLGGDWETTQALMTEGGMQWAYSELFQNYSGQQVAGYLDHSLKQSQRAGLLVHYSETHDNDRLAARGHPWSLLRNRLCALAGVSGGFGFTCGVEWLTTQRIDVHGNASLAWGNPDNLVPELAKLNQLLAEHPCFFDGAKVTRLSPSDSAVYALRRESEEGTDAVLVLLNTDLERTHTLTLDKSAFTVAGCLDLLGQTAPEIKATEDGKWVCTLPPAAAFCMAPTLLPRGLSGQEYRRARVQAAWALTALSRILPVDKMPAYPWRGLATLVDEAPGRFLAAIPSLKAELAQVEQDERQLSQPVEALRPQGRLPVGDISIRNRDQSTLRALGDFLQKERFPRVLPWTLLDIRRIALVPPGHWLLIQDTVPFRAVLNTSDGSPAQYVQSIPVRDGHIASFAPYETAADAQLTLERYSQSDQRIQATIRFLASEPAAKPHASGLAHLPRQSAAAAGHATLSTDLVLLTNGRGGMARICLDLGRVTSKYDCVLGANLHPSLPVDRHVLVKRLRVWVNADGFISPLDFTSLASFEPGPPAIWNFVANAGDGRTVEIRMAADMLEGRNTTVFQFRRPTAEQAVGKQLPAEADVRLTLRVDIEDRNFHWETRRNSGAEHHFATHVHTLGTEAGGVGHLAPVPAPPDQRRREPNAPSPRVGFAFNPATDRQLRVFTNTGSYHPVPEWSENLPHPLEQSRGQTGSGDAFSPGWFDLPLPKGSQVTLLVTADPTDPAEPEVSDWMDPEHRRSAEGTESDWFESQLRRAARAFMVRRDSGKTVIAGYPWFLDWGRDTFICARGLLAAGLAQEVKQLLVTFGRFEQNGTLPNTIHGDDASNRDTSDAPLWFALVCEELATGPASPIGSMLYQTAVQPSGRTLRDVLHSIAIHYIKGTPNGIRMDPGSALIWSPSHFTWMDTNYPACTPREGFPVEIQALWIRLLRQLACIGVRADGKGWEELAAQALASVDTLFWREGCGHYADVLLARAGEPAAQAVVDDSLRSNCLFVVSLGLVAGQRAQRCVEAALRYLVVPGALRTLAPQPVSVPLPIRGTDGRLLNDPSQPYWGRYEGDEDTRRKPAYHNGTAWTWTFPVFCEALARAWNFAPDAVAAAKAYLGSMDRLLTQGCIGQLPEILDGDAPHAQRGCDAQAWGVTEALRVWKLLNGFDYSNAL